MKLCLTIFEWNETPPLKLCIERQLPALLHFTQRFGGDNIVYGVWCVYSEPGTVDGLVGPLCCVCTGECLRQRHYCQGNWGLEDSRKVLRTRDSNAVNSMPFVGNPGESVLGFLLLTKQAQQHPSTHLLVIPVFNINPINCGETTLEFPST